MPNTSSRNGEEKISREDFRTILELCTEGITKIENDAVDSLRQIASVVKRILSTND